MKSNEVVNQQNETPSKQTKRSRTSLLFIILIVLLAVTSAVFVYKYYEFKTEMEIQIKDLTQRLEQETRMNVEEETKEVPEGLRSFTIQDLYFEYPEDWTLNYKRYSTEAAGNSLPVVNLTRADPDESPLVTVSVIENPNNLSIKNFNERLPGFFISEEAETWKVSGETGYYEEQEYCSPHICDFLAFKYKDKVYKVSLVYDVMDSEVIDEWYEEYNPVFQQILSSFDLK